MQIGKDPSLESFAEGSPIPLKKIKISEATFWLLFSSRQFANSESPIPLKI